MLKSTVTFHRFYKTWIWSSNGANNIYQRAGSQRSTLAFLDQITGDLINITTTPRAQQRPHNSNTDPVLDSRAGETHRVTQNPKGTQPPCAHGPKQGGRVRDMTLYQSQILPIQQTWVTIVYKMKTLTPNW